jgi:hypothetical protein
VSDFKDNLEEFKQKYKNESSRIIREFIKEGKKTVLKNMVKKTAVYSKQQENKMQKFKQGDIIEANVFDDVWLKAKFICDDDGYPVIRYLEEYADDNGIQVDYDGIDSLESFDCIRPAQLICDEARELIGRALEEDLNILFKFESDEIFEEYLSLITNQTRPSVGWQTIARKSGACIVDGVEHYVCSDYKDYQELNLKTGEVIPCEEVLKPATPQEMDNAVDICYYEEKIERLNKKLKDAFSRNVKSLEQLKEKDAEIERLKIDKVELQKIISTAFCNMNNMSMPKDM